jgi:hypothetical protein
MKLFVTGASGYIGGSVASKLRDAGHEVLGLVRSEEKARLVKERVLEPIVGTLNDATILQNAARQEPDHPEKVTTVSPSKWNLQRKRGHRPLLSPTGQSDRGSVLPGGCAEGCGLSCGNLARSAGGERASAGNESIFLQWSFRRCVCFGGNVEGHGRI